MIQSAEYEDKIAQLKERKEKQTQTIQSLRSHIETLEEAISEKEAKIEENEFGSFTSFDDLSHC